MILSFLSRTIRFSRFIVANEKPLDQVLRTAAERSTFHEPLP
jgi:hypothetical protein